MRWGLATDAGRVRERNEDSAIAEPRIFAVADGMGGHAGGDVASRIAIEELSGLASKVTLTREDIAAAIAHANARIVEFSRASADGNAGTTLTGLAVVSDTGVEHWLVFNVGDSRVYRFAGDALLQITTDHSEVQELVEEGSLDASEARTHEGRNVVTRALGSDPAPEVDWWLLPLTAGERFVVCSDGLCVELPDDQIRSVVASVPLEELAGELVRLALDSGGRDNVTAIAVEVEGDRKAHEPDEDTRPRAAVAPQ